MSTVPCTRDLEKQIIILTKRLAASERERVQLESVKDKADILLMRLEEDRVIISQKNSELAKLYHALADANAKSEQLLLNVLPEKIADELKHYGRVVARKCPEVTVVFTDLVAFTAVAERLTAEQLLDELDTCFTQFDTLIAQFGLEKLKTIGDSYMFAGGLLSPTPSHAVDCLCAALEMQRFIESERKKRQERGEPYWQMRIGLHSGPVMAGVIGHKKFSFDIWGNTVNLASRMESSGVAGRVNVSQETMDRANDFFEFESRGPIQTKREGLIQMYLVNKIKEPFCQPDGYPNPTFWEARNYLINRTTTYGQS